MILQSHKNIVDTIEKLRGFFMKVVFYHAYMGGNEKAGYYNTCGSESSDAVLHHLKHLVVIIHSSRSLFPILIVFLVAKV